MAGLFVEPEDPGDEGKPLDDPFKLGGLGHVEVPGVNIGGPFLRASFFVEVFAALRVLEWEKFELPQEE